MNQELPDDHISKKKVIYRVPGMDGVTVRGDLVYGTDEAGALTMDVYYPRGSEEGARLPAVVSVTGYPDPGMARVVGCRFKEMGSSTSWARLIAASGLVAVNYSNRDPAADLHSLLAHLRHNASSLGIDEKRIGILASSGHGPLALSVLMENKSEQALRCAVLICPMTLDGKGFTSIAEAARTFRFVNPGAGKSVDDLPRTIPLFIARAGQDQMPGLNDALDRFVTEGLARNLPLTLVNHPDAPHAFDLMHDSDTSREIIRRALGFLQFHLGVAG